MENIPNKTFINGPSEKRNEDVPQENGNRLILITIYRLPKLSSEEEEYITTGSGDRTVWFLAETLSEKKSR